MTAPGAAPPLRLDLRALVRRAWAERVALVRLHAVVALAAVAVAFALPRWYAASVTLVPAPRDGLQVDFTGAGLGAGALSAPLGLGPTPQDQLRMVVTSRAVADSVIQRFALVRHWGLRRRQQARDRLAEHVAIATPREGQVVVEIEAESATRARDMAAAWAEFTASESARLRTSLAAQRRRHLEARLAALERDLAGAGDRLRGFEERHGVVALPEQTGQALGALGALRQQMALLDAELAGARRWFTDASPEVATLSARRAELARQVESLARHGGTLAVPGTGLPAIKQRYLALANEVQSLVAVSGILRRLVEQARVEEASPMPAFSVLDAPDLPERHARPRRGLLVALALALTAAASLGRLAWREARAGAPDDLALAPAAPERAA
jgi:uncharacterized protein involved in exopolysaccharide biosynthesis